MSDKSIKVWTWVARVLALIGLLAGGLAAAERLPDWLQNYAALGNALVALAVGWVRGFLPAVKSKVLSVAIVGLVLVLVAIPASSCKVPPVVTLYRVHGLIVTGRDGADKLLHTTQGAAVARCRASHQAPAEEWRTKLIACLENAVAPLRPWVKHIKPALTAAGDALWLVLEAVHVAGDSTLSTSDKALAVACTSLTAAQTTLKQYAEQLGNLAKMILGAVAGGKVLVCR